MPRTEKNKENLDRSVYLSYWNALDPSEYSFLSFILYKLEYGRCIKLTKKSLQQEYEENLLKRNENNDVINKKIQSFKACKHFFYSLSLLF